MDKRSKYAMLIGIGATAASLPVRAALYKPAKVQGETLPDENVDLDRYRRNLRDAIRIKTIASDDAEKTDWAPFDEFHALLRERGADCTLEWNSGNHFAEPALRTAKAFAWTMRTQNT